MNYLLSIYFILFSSVLYGQQLIFNQTPLNNQLPSKECYGVFQDSRGYIWITTELGLCKLSGSHLKIYNKRNGLPENAIYAFTEYGNKYWLATSKNRLLTLVNDELYESRFSATYQQVTQPNKGHTYQLYASNNLILNSNDTTFELDTIAKSIKAPNVESGKIYIDWTHGISLHYGMLPKVINGNFQLQITGRSKQPLSIKVPIKSISSHRFLAATNGTFAFISLGRTLIRVNQNHTYEIFHLPADIIQLYVDSDKDLWIGLYKNGVYHCSNGDIKHPIKSLTSLSVSGILQDNEQNIWCTTLEKGVFMAKTKKIVDYANTLGNYYGQALIKTVANSTLFLRNYQLYAINGNVSPIGIERKRANIGNQFIDTYQNQPLFFNTTQVYDFVQIDNVFYTISYGNICRINANQLQSHSLKSAGRCIAKLNQHTLLYGCDDGIYSLAIRENRHHKIISTPDRPTKILINREKECLIATKGSGVFKLEHQTLVPLKLPAEIIYDIAEDAIGNLWFASNKGLIKKEPNGRNLVFSNLNGLLSNEVYKLTINQKQLFCLTSEGLISIPLTAAMLNSKPPIIYLKSAQTATNYVHLSNITKLKYHQNSIKLKFDILSFKNEEVKLKYRLSPLDTTYRFAFDEQIELENLPPNNYHLQVQAVNSDGFSSKPILINFQIEKPFWQTWWFILIAVGIAVAVVFLIVRYLFIKTRKKELERARIKQLIAESQLTALQAQMNPHFIFNCINSIQNYVLKKQEKDAYNYLSRFSQLIRMVLTHSQERSVSLNDELLMLDLYISLEQLRFSNSFEYVKDIDEHIDLKSILIPAMLVQPYVENAIWHGLMHLDEAKNAKLVIAVKTQGEMLILKVKDNGIGREMAATYRKDNLHQPFGVNFNHQRIEVLNQTFGNGKQFSVKITDLPNNNGTEVTIYIPI